MVPGLHRRVRFGHTRLAPPSSPRSGLRRATVTLGPAAALLGVQAALHRAAGRFRRTPWPRRRSRRIAHDRAQPLQGRLSVEILRPFFLGADRQDPVDELVRQAVLAQPEAFTLADIAIQVPAASQQLIKKVLATLKTDANGYAKFAPGLSRGTGGLAPGLVVASDKSGDYNFLDMVQTAFDLSDRGVKGRPAAEPRRG